MTKMSQMSQMFPFNIFFSSKEDRFKYRVENYICSDEKRNIKYGLITTKRPIDKQIVQEKFYQSIRDCEFEITKYLLHQFPSKILSTPLFRCQKYVQSLFLGNSPLLDKQIQFLQLGYGLKLQLFDLIQKQHILRDEVQTVPEIDSDTSNKCYDQQYYYTTMGQVFESFYDAIEQHDNRMVKSLMYMDREEKILFNMSEIKYEKEVSPLLLAYENQNLEMFKFFVDNTTIDLDQVDKQTQQTMLQHCIKEKDYEMVEYLLENGASPQPPCQVDQYIERMKRISIDDYYFYKIHQGDGNSDINENEEGGDQRTTSFSININNYTTPLAIATLNDSYDIVFLLLFYGANPNKKYGIYEKTLLHCCVENDLYDIAELLLDSGANPNVKDLNGHTPFTLSVNHDNADFVELLLVKGVNCLEDDLYELCLKNRSMKVLKKYFSDYEVITNGSEEPYPTPRSEQVEKEEDEYDQCNDATNPNLN